MDARTVIANTSAKLLARVVERSKYVRHKIRSLEFSGKARVVAFVGPTAEELIVACDGIRYKLTLNDDIQRAIYFNAYEPEVHQVLSVLPTNALCLDIGANIGFYSLHFAKYGTVHAFECDPANFQRLNENIRLNGFENVYAHELAVSDKKETLTFYQSGASHSGWGSLARFDDIAEFQITVNSTTLDNFLRTHSIEGVDLLKVDIEGAEFELLEGAQESLRNQVFKYILIEFNGARLAQRGRTFEMFDVLFSSYGYSPVLLNLDLYERMKSGMDIHLCVNFLYSAT